MNFVSQDPPPKTIYASPLMVRRREKMLSETWKLISEQGADGFTIPELCRRAGVSQGTFYNAFGTKENVIGLAVVEYASTVVGAHYVYRDDTLEGRLERLSRVNNNILPNKRYISAVMKIFWSAPATSETRQTIGDITKLGILRLLEKAKRRQGISVQINIDDLADSMMLNYYALLASWTAGSIRDEDLGRRVAIDTLLMLAGATRGATAKAVREWQDEVAKQGPRWQELVRIAAQETVAVDVP